MFSSPFVGTDVTADVFSRTQRRGGFFFLPIYFRGHEEAHTAADRHVGRFVTTILFQRFRSSHWLLAGFVSGILLEKVCRDRFNNDAILLTQ